MEKYERLDRPGAFDVLKKIVAEMKTSSTSKQPNPSNVNGRSKQ